MPIAEHYQFQALGSLGNKCFVPFYKRKLRPKLALVQCGQPECGSTRISLVLPGSSDCPAHPRPTLVYLVPREPHPSWAEFHGVAPHERWEAEALGLNGLVTWYRVQNSALQAPTYRALPPGPQEPLAQPGPPQGLLPSPGTPQYSLHSFSE